MVFAEPIQSLYVKEDKTRPYEILANLLSNAIKFTKKGTISISTDVNDNNYVIIAVKDTGEGINSEIAPRFLQNLYNIRCRNRTGPLIYPKVLLKPMEG